MKWRSFLSTAVALSLLGMGSIARSQNIPLFSWEDNDFEGWTVTGFTSRPTEISIGSFGVTDGSQSLEIDQVGAGFNWAVQIGDLPADSPQRAAVLAAAANPGLYEFRFDVGMDTSLIPQSRIGYLGISMFVNSGVENGFHAFFNAVINNGKTTGVFPAVIPVSALAPISTDPTGFLQLGFAINGDWDDPNSSSDDDLASIFIDNLRLFNRSALADLDHNSQVNLQDWAIFMANHKTDLSGLTPDEQLAHGDIDRDGDNDFNDFMQFEQIYDLVNGSGALANAVPEPSTLAMSALGLVACLRLARRRAVLVGAAAMVAIGMGGSTVQAQLLSSWETGLEGWEPTGFQAFPLTLGTSTVGATQGSKSLEVAQGGQGFSWNTRVSYTNGSPQYQAFRDAIASGTENFVMEMDVTYDPAFISGSSYLQTFLVLNVDGNWSQRDNLAAISTPQTNAVHISEPLNSWTSIASATAPNEIQVVIGANGDWPGTATFHYDNLRLRQVVFPNQLTLEVGAGGATRILNNSGAPVNFDYYEITSPAGGLDAGGWNSLDAQNIGAVDGPDGGTAAGDSPGEGWDKASGSVHDLTEAFLNGSTTLAKGSALTLGNAIANRDQDLKFRFRTHNGDHLITGIVKYVLQCDLNGDGAVDAADAGIMFGDWGQTANSPADKNADGFVDAADAGIMFAEWTGDPAVPTANAATAEYNTVTGELKISSAGAVNVFVQSASNGITPLNPAPVAPVGLLTNNASRIGLTNLGPINLSNYSFGSIGKGLAMNDLKLVYTPGLGQKGVEIAAGSAGFAYVPEPTGIGLLVTAACITLLGRRRV